LAAQSNDQPFPPHRIVGGVYYVGSESLASYLITTSAGHILINSSFAKTVPLIQASVEKLKFRFQDVKILLQVTLRYQALQVPPGTAQDRTVLAVSLTALHTL
jgi:hypothetical protein